MEKLVAIPTIGSGLVLEGKKGLVDSILFEGASMSISLVLRRGYSVENSAGLFRS